MKGTLSQTVRPAKTLIFVIRYFQVTLSSMAKLPVRQDGRLFRCKTRSGPGKLISELCGKTDISFHPHKARHTFGDPVMEKGAGFRDLMDAGGWKED